MIVDDNEVVRRLIRSIVADLVEEIYECADGAEALSSYHLYRQGVVLMDLEMPEVDGIAATRQIKETSPDAKIIIVSAHDNPILRRAAEDAGARAFVSKENLLELRLIMRAP